MRIVLDTNCLIQSIPWADGTWNEQKHRDLENAHYRTPYEKHIT